MANKKTDKTADGVVLVKMVFEISGTRNGLPWPARGKTIELPADEAAALIDQGAAVETTEVDEDENVVAAAEVKVAADAMIAEENAAVEAANA